MARAVLETFILLVFTNLFCESVCKTLLTFCFFLCLLLTQLQFNQEVSHGRTDKQRTDKLCCGVFSLVLVFFRRYCDFFSHNSTNLLEISNTKNTRCNFSYTPYVAHLMFVQEKCILKLRMLLTFSVFITTPV